ncbi:MAG TPA: fatty acid desaturase [Thermoanaerobaculia bacterium]|nr:fatty acid desaturase [Thermoanaerobaculia bacterium]
MSEGTEPVPGALNLALAAAAPAAALGLLAFASHTSSWGWRIAAAVAFSYVNNTIFSLLHEAVHGHLHPHPRVNEAAGRFLAAFFPTGLGFQRVCHLGHHRRNRTDAEVFDYILPGESRLLKTVQWYSILTGLYWLLPPLGCLLYLLWPGFFRLPERLRGTRYFRQTSTAAMLSGFEGAPERTIRLEILFSFAFQAVCIWLLDLSAAGWLACYAAFGFNWSSPSTRTMRSPSATSTTAPGTCASTASSNTCSSTITITRRTTGTRRSPGSICRSTWTSRRNGRPS